jgi:hypothetical protein
MIIVTILSLIYFEKDQVNKNLIMNKISIINLSIQKNMHKVVSISIMSRILCLYSDIFGCHS